MKKIIYSGLLLALSTVAISQENMFLVYSLKGNVSIVSNKVESKAKIGTILQNDAVIKVAQGSFATLICNETRLFSLTKSGNYSVTSLSDSCKEVKSSLTSNYVKYIWSEFTKAHGSPEKNRTAYMANVGAVSRGINNVWIDPKLDTLNYVSGTIPLSWKSYTDAEDFEFKLYDLAGATLFTKTVKKKHVDMGELLKTIHPGRYYMWTATIKGEPDNEEKKILHYVTKEEYNSFYTSIKNHDAAETEAEATFRLGFLLEESHYLVEAYQHYLKATQLAPDNPLYRFTFMSFKKDYEIK